MFSIIKGLPKYVPAIIILIIASLGTYYFINNLPKVIDERTLSDTQVIIKHVDNVEKMITSAHYGEVLASSHEVNRQNRIIRITEEETYLKLTYEKYQEKALVFKNSLENGMKQNKVIQSTIDFFKKQGYVDQEDFQHLLGSIKRLNLFPRDMEKRKSKILVEHFLERPWGKFVIKEDPNIQKLAGVKSTIKNIKNTLHSETSLAYIGRGIVKAGFNFKDFSANQIDSIDGAIIIEQDFDPKIIYADINPWMVVNSDSESDTISGFEIITPDVRLSDDNWELSKKVKVLCKEN